jgi:hypothetical protein
MALPPELGALVAELNREGLDYVVVGGVAVNLLGYVRATNDLDVLVPATPAQGDRIRALLERLGATRPDGSELPSHLFDGEHHVRALTPSGLIDFIPEGESPLTYEAVRAAARADELGGQPVLRVGLAHLTLLKRLADRPRDREDLAALEQAYGPLPAPE